MAKFIDAYKKVLNNEGIYSNDPDDAGGETYKGISRKANPNWDGWISIDAIKKAHPTTFKGILKKTPAQIHHTDHMIIGLEVKPGGVIDHQILGLAAFLGVYGTDGSHQIANQIHGMTSVVDQHPAAGHARI